MATEAPTGLTDALIISEYAEAMKDSNDKYGGLQETRRLFARRIEAIVRKDINKLMDGIWYSREALNEAKERVRKDEQERTAYALRTRPDYDFRCQRCGAPHNLDTSIPSNIWNQIVEHGSPGGDKYSALCTLCIDDLMFEKGLTGEAKFYFIGRALKTESIERGGEGDDADRREA